MSAWMLSAKIDFACMSCSYFSKVVFTLQDSHQKTPSWGLLMLGPLLRTGRGFHHQQGTHPSWSLRM